MGLIHISIKAMLALMIIIVTAVLAQLTSTEHWLQVTCCSKLWVSRNYLDMGTAFRALTVVADWKHMHPTSC